MNEKKDTFIEPLNNNTNESMEIFLFLKKIKYSLKYIQESEDLLNKNDSILYIP